MALAKRYNPQEAEPALQARWQEQGIYHYAENDPRPVYSIDTPPPTVSGHLHLGHIYSYSHADFMARFFRMRGYNVFYPMGFDDNGLPTERLVEKRLKITAAQVGRQAFIEQCLRVSEEMEEEYRALWQRLGLSIDWRYSYRTIDERARRATQHSFIDLYHKGLAYRSKAPGIWCPECRTAIAQAELADLPRTSEFITLPFERENDEAALPIATTRPELLAACVAVFVHPEDGRYARMIGSQVKVPLYGQSVPVLADPAADPQKGSGAVMCCTFGDQTDVAWWHAHRLPLIEAIDAAGCMTAAADLADHALQGLTALAARAEIKAILAARGLILARQPVEGTIRVHERCDTPVEYRITPQWFIRVLEHKETFLALGRQIRWHPESMHARYQAWVENLNWDWCISRQRIYAPTFPLWYCKDCGAILLADENQLPVDPLVDRPPRACACGSTAFEPETDVMDTWATSSVSPEIASGWLEDPARFDRLFPMTLRPQAHEIIRTWAFYTIVKSWYHFGRLPWSDVFISGWGLAGEGMGKISKSRGGGPMPPMEMIRRTSADAVRYWAASTSTGRDALISEDKIQMGARLATKLWNVARFAEPFITGAGLDGAQQTERPDQSTPADRWLLAALDAVVARTTASFEQYEYAQAKAEIERFFWRDLADNYLEMAKLRLYDPAHPAHAGACRALKTALKTLLKLFAPLLPYVTEAIWSALFAAEDGGISIHNARWPEPAASSAVPEPEEAQSAAGYPSAELAFGETLISLATAARRYKSEHALSLGSELGCLWITTAAPDLAERLEASTADLMSVTRARRIEVRLSSAADAPGAWEAGLTPLAVEDARVQAAVARNAPD